MRKSRNGIVRPHTLPLPKGSNALSEICVVPLNATTIIARNGLFRGLPEQTITQITALASRRSYKPEDRKSVV